MKEEIVAVMIGTIITNSPKLVLDGINKGTITRLLTRQHMQLMAAFDLGPRWTNLATGPTLFEVDSEKFDLY